jgi:hypothetical protein
VIWRGRMSLLVYAGNNTIRKISSEKFFICDTERVKNVPECLLDTTMKKEGRDFNMTSNTFIFPQFPRPPNK